MTANRVGIDFSQAYFDLLIADSQGRPLTGVKRFAHDRLGCQAALEFICQTCEAHPADELWIGGEATGLLWWHPFQQWALEPRLGAFRPIFYQLNPAPVKHFRKSLPGQEKADPNDARLITRYLGMPDLDLHPWFADVAHWPLRLLTRYRCRLAHRLSALKAQAHTLLYLQASAYDLVEPFSDVLGRTSQEMILRYPTLDHFATTPLETLAIELAQALQRGRFPDPLHNARKLQEVAQRSYPLDPRVATVTQWLLADLFQLIRLHVTHLKHLDRQIEKQVEHDADVANLDSIGGIGPVYAAGLVAELRPTQRFFVGEHFDLRRGTYQPRTWRQAQASVAKLAGLWWPKNDSGKYKSQDARLPKACNPYLRYYLIEAADHVRGSVAEYGAYYDRKYRQATKHHHWRALVLTARKLARLVFALLHKHQSFQPRRSTPA